MAALHLLPVPLFEGVADTIPLHVQQIAVGISHYFVENVRTARRALKLYDKSVDIDAIVFEEISKNKQPSRAVFARWVAEGHDIGLMSEAGCPAVVDPGDMVVTWAHQMGLQVRPHTGPNSVLLALMASGFDGQHFEFLGYLPIPQAQRSRAITKMEAARSTQIFIEAPFRNNQLLEGLLQDLKPSTMLCIASELTSPDESIKVLSVADWKLQQYDYHKKPTIFLVGHSEA